MLKLTWSIQIGNSIHRLAPAHFDAVAFNNRKQFTGRFRGFDLSHTASKAMEVLTFHNPKNAYKGSVGGEFFVEFEHEHDLFNACERTKYFNNHKVTGLPSGYNWKDRMDFLNKFCKKKTTDSTTQSSSDFKNKENSYPSYKRSTKDKNTVTKAVIPSTSLSATSTNRTPLGPRLSRKELNINITRASKSLNKSDKVTNLKPHSTSTKSHSITAADVSSLTSPSSNIVKSTNDAVDCLC